MHFFRLLILGLFSVPFLLSAQHTRVSLENFNITLQKPENIESVGIIVWDQREQIIDGRQRPSLLGYTRSLTAIAYPSTIKSKVPLAEWVSGRISKSYEENGLATLVITTSPYEKWSQIEKKMKSSNADQFLVVRLKKFQFDGIMKFSYMAEIDVEVFSESGELITSKHISDERVMGGTGGWKKKFPLHMVSIIEDAINNPEVANSFGKQSAKKSTQKSEGATDIIITKKGDEIDATVEEITSDLIRYRKASQPDGPLRNLPISDVFMVKYKDGTKEVFD
jgi:hypothetical protein